MTIRPALLASLSLLLVQGGCGVEMPVAQAMPDRPMRVMSLNQCTDQLLLALLPPDRIASVTWLSRDPRYSAQVEAARRVPVNHGSVEEVARTRPDLIVTDTFSNPAGRAMLRRLGYPVIELADSGNVAGIRQNVAALANALREENRGRMLIARMDRQLVPKPLRRPVTVASWGRDGMGESPLLTAIVDAAGLKLVGEQGGVEALLRTKPDYLIRGVSDPREGTLGDNVSGHPLVRRLWPATKRLVIAQSATICGTPAIGDAAVKLRQSIDAKLAS
ncbi:ABC transporter substrate-binding protein [Sphingomonas aliaeris]|uniref:ABC transporter substrate-binding protein n=1 Tax=Sphingomonas aliaeris TaxID=2759526 RepID=A0A974NSB4_9SPHN|nr:ABC transporter substrate-binding protein [Sphingomonas aliaeris]QQV76004.1 ABC transporter substrate-binding protein [Sphingomonas aliaeris]